MMRLQNLTMRNALIATHDALATGAAIFVSFYLRFEGNAFYDRVPLLLRMLPYFIVFSVVVCYAFKLTTTKWRFISLPDALNILKVATVLTTLKAAPTMTPSSPTPNPSRTAPASPMQLATPSQRTAAGFRFANSCDWRSMRRASAITQRARESWAPTAIS